MNTVVKFSTPLLGITNVVSGYKFKVNNLSKQEFRDLISYMAKTWDVVFSLTQSSVSISTYTASGVAVANIDGRCYSTLIVVDSLERLNQLVAYLDIDINIEDQTVVANIKSVINNYSFELVSNQLVKDIRTAVAERLRYIGFTHQSYDVAVDSKYCLHFSINDTAYSVPLIQC